MFATDKRLRSAEISNDCDSSKSFQYFHLMGYLPRDFFNVVLQQFVLYVTCDRVDVHDHLIIFHVFLVVSCWLFSYVVMSTYSFSPEKNENRPPRIPANSS